MYFVLQKVAVVFFICFGYSLLFVIVIVSYVLNCYAILAYGIFKVHFGKEYIFFFATMCLFPHSCSGGMCSAWAETAGSRLSAQQQGSGTLHEGGEELRPS